MIAKYHGTWILDRLSQIIKRMEKTEVVLKLLDSDKGLYQVSGRPNNRPRNDRCVNEITGCRLHDGGGHIEHNRTLLNSFYI